MTDKPTPQQVDPSRNDFGEPILLTSTLGASDDAEIRDYGAQWLIETSDRSSTYKLVALRQSGVVEHLWLTKTPLDGGGGTETVAHVAGDAALRLIAVIRNEAFTNVAGTSAAAVDLSVLADIASMPITLDLAYLAHAEELRERLRNDATAEDVIAVAHRREVVRKFRQMMEDDKFFELESKASGGPEKAWQKLFESNAWLLGASLGAQLFLAWDEERLEQLVAGWPLNKFGKRVDALLTSAGRIKSAVFAEIKHHKIGLLSADDYRPGCWAPFKEVVGAVAQSHGTVYRAMEEFGDRIRETASDGSEVPGEATFLFRPRSYVVVGNTAEFIGESGGPHVEKVRSFEMYRQSLKDPEVITFDEVLARAEWLVQLVADAR